MPINFAESPQTWSVADLTDLPEKTIREMDRHGIGTFHDLLSLGVMPGDRRGLAEELDCPEYLIHQAVASAELAVTLKLDKGLWILLIRSRIYDARDLGRCVCSTLRIRLEQTAAMLGRSEHDIPGIPRLQQLIDAALVSPRLVVK